MKQISLNIPDKKYQFFMEFVKSLKFVKVEEPEAVPQWQQDEVAKRLDLIGKSEMKPGAGSRPKRTSLKNNDLYCLHLTGCRR